MIRSFTLAILIMLLAAACGRVDTSGSEEADTLELLLMVPQGLITAQPETLAEDPVIAGSLQLELCAELRAKVSGTVLQVLKANGDHVAKKGEGSKINAD